MNGARPAPRPIWSAIRSAAATLPVPVLVRFLGAGALNTAFGYTVFLLVLRLGADAAVALVVSTAMGIAFNFQTSRRLVFRSRRPGRLPRFVAVYAIVLLVDYAGIVALRHLGLPDWAAQAALVLPMALLAFCAQRRFVFDAGRQLA